MYPYDIFAGIDLYVIMLCVAVLGALTVYGYLSGRRGIGAKLHNLCLYNAVAAVVFGYFSAVIFQAFYNIPKYGELRIDSQTGATFYGGLIGGAGLFLAIYFLVGARLFSKTREHINKFWTVADIGAACIAIAHGFGRIGCLMAGCCHGARTDKWYGIYMKAVGARVVPIQLFEAIFLFALFALLFYRALKGKTYNLPIYMGTYGVWRFFIEYARDDYRGFSAVKFLTPSQLTAVVMVLGAAALFVLEYKYVKKQEAKENEE